MEKNKHPFGIIAAMDQELQQLIDDIQSPVTENISGIYFVSGTLYEQPVVMAICGVGKVAASICAQIMILRYAPRLIIKTGVAGTLTNQVGIGGIVVADRTVQHDMDTTAVGDPPGLISRINKVFFDCFEDSSILQDIAKKLGYQAVMGTVATGDQFVCEKERKEKIIELFDAVACEMEAAAVSQVGFVNQTPICILLSISDEADGTSPTDYPAFTSLAASHNMEIIRAYLKQVPEKHRWLTGHKSADFFQNTDILGS